MKATIRLGNEKDLPAIVRIYNQAIRSGIATGDLTEFTVDQRRSWFQQFTSDDYPIYVLEIAEKVVGYGTLSPYRPGRGAMMHIAEISFFLDNDYQQKGLGSQLVQHMINDCPRIKKKSLLAILLSVNGPSIKLLEKFHFELWGTFPGVIRLRDQTCSQLIYGLTL